MGGMGKRLRRQAETGLFRQGPCGGQLRGELAVALRIDHHGNVGKILRRRPDHRRTADIDILHRLGQLHPRAGDGLSKGIEVHHHQRDGHDLLLLQLPPVLLQLQAGQQAAVDQRMERLHPPPQNLGKTGHRRCFDYRDAPLDEGAGSPPGRDDLPAQPDQLPGQLDDAALVGDAEERPFLLWTIILFQ